jgi:hypothetical protein
MPVVFQHQLQSPETFLKIRLQINCFAQMRYRVFEFSFPGKRNS